MSRTAKDRRRLQTISKVYEIVRAEDGSFSIFRNSQLRDNAIPEKWLEDQLVKYGICGEEYRTARRKLDQFGRVKLTY